MNRISASFFVFLSIANASFESCGAGRVKITQLDAVPLNTVQRGQPISLYFTFNVQAGTWINAGTITVKSSLNYIPVSSYSEPLCSRFKCPLAAGEHSYNYADVFPNVWGRVNTDIIVTNSSGAPLLCARWLVRTV